MSATATTVEVLSEAGCRRQPPIWTVDYIGLPFAELGRDRTGLDCWGLARLVLAERFGLGALPDFRGQYRTTRDRQLADVFRAEMARWQPVADSQPGGGSGPGIHAGSPHWGVLPGDVVVLRIGGAPAHVGVVVAPGWMLTIDRKTASHLDRLDSLRWRGRIEGYFRHAR